MPSDGRVGDMFSTISMAITADKPMAVTVLCTEEYVKSNSTLLSVWCIHNGIGHNACLAGLWFAIVHEAPAALGEAYSGLDLRHSWRVVA